MVDSEKVSIYDDWDVSSDAYLSVADLEEKLNNGLKGLDLSGLPLRTRSKVVKSKVCDLLGYPVPKSFKKTKPRFPVQNFDTYIQKSLNLQIWNEDIDAERRYVLVGVDGEDVVCGVKVLKGIELINYDNTGTLTSKYQAKMPSESECILYSHRDTDNVLEWCEIQMEELVGNPTDSPMSGTLMPIGEIYSRLLALVGLDLAPVGAVQERNHGAELHKAICKTLGYKFYMDPGRYPDIPNQLIEVKLQTSPTIDLGAHNPNDDRDVVISENKHFSARDIRYVIFGASIHDKLTRLDSLFVVTGEEFVDHFTLFSGKVMNAKVQLKLPNDIFNREISR